MMSTRTQSLKSVQRAYLVGRQPDTVLGGVSTHGYFEFTTPRLDPGQLHQAINKAISLHDALRTVVYSDRVEVLEDVPSFPLAIHDLRCLPDEQANAELTTLRETQSTLVRPCSQWPLFGITLVILDQETRVLVDVDGLTLDLASVHLLLAEITGSVEAGLDLAPGSNSTPSSRSRAYWAQILPELPPAPRLPLVCHPADISGTCFTSRTHFLTTDHWHTAMATGRRHGLTPSGLALTLFAETLYRATGQNRFSLVVPLNRRPRQAPCAIGAFSNFLPVGFDWSALTLAERGRDAQRRLLVAAMHGDVDGPELLGSLMRSHHRAEGGLLPVVFTSGIGLAPASMPDNWCLAELRSQTAGIWLDGQVTEIPQGLMIHWDSVDDVVGTDRADELFAVHVELWTNLIDGLTDLTRPLGDTPHYDSGWEPLVVPATAVEQVLCIAWSTATGIWPMGTHDDLLARGANPSTAKLAANWLTDWFGFPLVTAADLAVGTTVSAIAAELTQRHPNLPRFAELSLIAAHESGQVVPSTVPSITRQFHTP